MVNAVKQLLFVKRLGVVGRRKMQSEMFLPPRQPRKQLLLIGLVHGRRLTH